MNLYGKAWPTYTVGYGKSAYKDDELADAAETARLLRRAHIPRWRSSRDTFERALPRIVSILEEPIAASSIVPMYFVCERARQDVKVALVGQGPDELFAGYTRHLGVQYGAQWRRLPRLAARQPRGRHRAAAAQRGAQARRLRARRRGPSAALPNVFSLMPGDEVDGAVPRPALLPAGAGDRIVDFWQDLSPRWKAPTNSAASRCWRSARRCPTS